MRESELVITTTPVRLPVFDAAWLHPGLHITAKGELSHATDLLEGGNVPVELGELTWGRDRVREGAKHGSVARFGPDSERLREG